MGVAPTVEKSGATILMTLPRPASTAARQLRRTLECCVPVSVTLTVEGQSRRKFWEVGKYEGHAVGNTIEYSFEPGIGLVRVVSAVSEREPMSEEADRPARITTDVLLPPRRLPLSGLGESVG